VCFVLLVVGCILQVRRLRARGTTPLPGAALG